MLSMRPRKAEGLAQSQTAQLVLPRESPCPFDPMSPPPLLQALITSCLLSVGAGVPAPLLGGWTVQPFRFLCPLLLVN